MAFTVQIKKEIVMTRFLKISIWLILLTPAIYLAVIWNKLPETIATHFDLNGNADKYGSKNQVLFATIVLTVVAALIYFLLPLIYKIDPKKTAVKNKAILQRLAIPIALFITFINCVLINSSEKGGIFLDIRLVFGSIGLMWCIIGNYIHNLKPNYFAGIRLPWTLNSEDNWRKTHLFAGKLWFASGLVLAFVCLFTSKYVSVIAFIIVVLVILIIPCIYSYRLYKKEKQHKK